MPQVHFSNGLGHSGRFSKVKLGRSAGLNRAEGAGACADVPQDHHGGGAPRPALTQIGTMSTLAYRVQVVMLNRGAGFLVGYAGG